MADENYHKLLERIALASGTSKEDLERKVEAKRAKLSGLISLEGAAQVIAAELGVNLDAEKLKIEELVPGMRKANVSGKVIRIFPVREFTTKKGDKGKVCNLVLADDTSNVKVVLWDTHHIELVEKGEIAEGTVIEIGSGSVRDNEIHLGSFSELKKSSETFDSVVEKRTTKEKSIADFKLGDNVVVRAFVVQSFDPRFFEVSAETGKKISDEEKAAGKAFEKRALINIVIDDGTESMRSVLFHENLQKIGLTDLENPELLAQQKENLLGKEFIFSGNVRRNSYFNNEELIIDDAKEVNLDELLAELEK